MPMTKEEMERQNKFENRMKAQEKRISEQRKMELNRVSKAEGRTGQRTLTKGQMKEEKEQLTTRSGKILIKSAKWGGIWGRKQAKWNRRKRKIRQG